MKRKTKKHLIQTVCYILVVVIFFMSHKIGMAKTEFNNITIYYHDEVVTNDTVLNNLYQKIVNKFADKGFPLPKSNYSVYLCKSSTEFKIKSITFSNGVRGKNFQFLDRMYIQEADITNDEVQTVSPALNKRTLSGTVAHELTHSYQQEKLGFFKYRTAPNWKLEGMADYVANQSSAKTADALPLFLNGETYSVVREPEPVVEKKKVVVKPVAAKPAEGADEMQDALRSPLPGTVIEIPVKTGMQVKEGDTLVVLEAMKMNNNLTAERDGIVKSILVGEGEAVKENTPLVTFE